MEEEAIYSAANNGETPLHLAAKDGHLGVVRFLLKAEGADVNCQDNDGYAPLHLAAEDGCLEVVKLLLQHRANVNLEAKDGYVPLHLAAMKDHEEIIMLLLQYGAIYNAQNCNNSEPLDLMDSHPHVEGLLRTIDGLFQLMSAKKADITDDLLYDALPGDILAVLNARNTDQKTLLDLASDKGFENIKNYFEGQLKFARSLLKSGGSHEIQNQPRDSFSTSTTSGLQNLQQKPSTSAYSSESRAKNQPSTNLEDTTAGQQDSRQL